jgi:predicted dienelactone hydrolase
MTAFTCGHRAYRIEDRSRARPAALDVWYPASAVEHDHGYGLGGGRVAEDADCADGRFAMILLSHGAFGSAGSYGWIAEHLARHGYLVCGVSHFGESPVYGPDTIDPRSVLEIEPRADDCTFAVDHMLGDSPLREHIDPARIGALGHSSGGATTVALASGVFDPAQMRRYCASDDARDDRGCAYGRGTPPPVGSSPRSHRDARVRAAVALDPALGPGFEASSLAAISIPFLVVGSVDNDFLPFGSHAGRYAGLIPGCASARLEEGEGHFVYLNECDSDLEANGVPLCVDREGVDRRSVHNRLGVLVRAFFDEHL